MGFIASLPFLLKAIVGPVGGALADLLRYKYMSTTNVRRLFFAVGKCQLQQELLGNYFFLPGLFCHFSNLLWAILNPGVVVFF